MQLMRLYSEVACSRENTGKKLPVTKSDTAILLKGLDLINGELGFIFSDVEEKRLSEYLRFALVMKFLTVRPNIDVIWQTVNKTWGLQRTIHCSTIDLPMYMYRPDCLRILATRFGRYLGTDHATLNRSRATGARICIEVDLLAEPVSGFPIVTSSRMHWQKVRYEKSGKQVKEGGILCDAMVSVKEVGPTVNTRDSGLTVVENAQTENMKDLLLEDESSEEMTVRGNPTCAETSAWKEDSTSFDSVEDHSKVVDEVLKAEDGHISIVQEGYPIEGDDLNVQCVANEQQ
ncbi:Hypothetical predicted protein [Olea europaea subsp. europaea]|uniref:DUF4283 domain-containing protein n=1 Tax=Olea europaea subsp. europaea TaxID=158383 RepID=A0A8S0RRX6_OLEEU|nr:Hypothetical predicted protein [Olea europaea subsp. europaea]